MSDRAAAVSGLDPSLLEQFRAIIARRLGLSFEASRLGDVAEVLSGRARELSIDVRAYLTGLQAGPEAEIAALARNLTVSETYFFRHQQQFEALAGLLANSAELARPPRINLLSAGCSSGEEAYSLAIIAGEVLQDRLGSVLAVDVNPNVLSKAQEGRFSAWSLRETPTPVRERWFRERGKNFELDSSIRQRVRFAQGNLVNDDPAIFGPCAYHVIFCRNVLMYFGPDQFRDAVARLHTALAPGGYLFLGSAETLREVSRDFDLCQARGAFYYQKRAGAGSESQRSSRAPRRGDATSQAWGSGFRAEFASPEAAPGASSGGTQGPSPDWVDAIGRAAARVRELSRPASRGAGEASPRALRRDDLGDHQAHSASGIRSDLRQPLEMLHREQFDEALSQVTALPAPREHDPDVLLLKAVLLSSGGKLGEAESVCQRLLAHDTLDAGAHYVLALCGAGRGQLERALQHHRIATYLDPHFAMPRLHLGLLLRRAGERRLARAELSQAMSLLEHEDQDRLALFGGGFGRSALLALCASELAASEGGS